MPHRIITVGIKHNCHERLGHKKESLIRLSLCFATVITLVINLCHLTVLHFEKRKWKKDRFQTNLHHTLKSQNRVNRMSNVVLSRLLKWSHCHTQPKGRKGKMPSCRPEGRVQSRHLRLPVLRGSERRSPNAPRRAGGSLLPQGRAAHACAMTSPCSA